MSRDDLPLSDILMVDCCYGDVGVVVLDDFIGCTCFCTFQPPAGVCCFREGLSETGDVSFSS